MLWESPASDLFSDYVAHLDGFSKIPGGWLNGHYIQLAYQLADSVSGFTYSFGGTCIILFVMNLIPGLSLRATEDAEIHGIDDAEIGEFAVSFGPMRPGKLFSFYLLTFPQYDFVEHQRDYVHGDITPPHDPTEKVSMKSGM